MFLMMDIRSPILATIIYYDAFDFPLTLAEVYKYLINPRRFSHPNVKSSVFNIEAVDIAEELDNMARAGVVGHKNGFYFMPGRENLYEERIEKDKLAGKKWKKFLRLAKHLQAAPYLRAVFVSGSLAANNPDPKSDFDVFVVIKSGRLYTGRVFLWIISSILGARRGRFDLVAPDKLCFNHYVTDDNLELTHRSLYIAQSLANMKPAIVSNGVIDNFTASNKWANFYCYNFKQTGEYRSVRPSRIMVALAKIGECALNNFFGGLLERLLKSFQQRRIKNNPATYESGGRIIFNDKELEFHPRSFERVVIDNYNNKLKKAGISSELENDSGLS